MLSWGSLYDTLSRPLVTTYRLLVFLMARSVPERNICSRPCL